MRAPIVGLKVETGQGVALLLPGGQYEPAGQNVGENVPLPVQSIPDGQSAQSEEFLAPVEFRYVLLGHGIETDIVLPSGQ